MKEGNTFTDMRLMIEHLTPTRAQFVLKNLKTRPATMNPLLWEKLVSKAQDPEPEPEKLKESQAIWDRFDFSDQAYRNDWKAFLRGDLGADDLSVKWRGRPPDRSVIADLSVTSISPGSAAVSPSTSLPIPEDPAAHSEEIERPVDEEEACFG